jgi:hypothetical protein
MEVVKPIKRVQKDTKRKIREKRPNASPLLIDFPALEPASDDTIYSTSEDEEAANIFATFNNKRRNDNPIEIQQPSSKRIKFHEYHCACCDYLCGSSAELERHFITNCPRRLVQNNELNPVFSFSSSDSSDL